VFTLLRAIRKNHYRAALSPRASLWVLWGPLLVFALLLGDSAARAQTAVAPAAGDGLTSATAYQIAELGNLVWLQEQAEADQTSGKFYTMVNDIDASATANWNDDGTDTDVLEGFRPIGPGDPEHGSIALGFNGVFNGNWHRIVGLTINRPATSGVGLFGCLPGGTVCNLAMQGGAVTGRWYVGNLVGANGAGVIVNCSASGSVDSRLGWVGGLVGTLGTGSIVDSYASCAVTARTDSAGGLVGYSEYGSVANCHSTGSVAGSSGIGGLLGVGYSTVITNSYATGSVTGSGDNSSNVGGLVGLVGGADDELVEDCHATGAVTGVTQVGGLVGASGGPIDNSYATGAVTASAPRAGGLVGDNWASVHDCYASGPVTGTSSVGGLFGFNEGENVTHCYSTGAVTGQSATDVGGLVGMDLGIVTASYWNTQTSGQATSDAGSGRTTAQMRQQATFVGWDFSSVWGIDADANSGYPYLQALATYVAPPAKATNPSPEDGATKLPVDVAPGWQGSAGATSYDLYFGVANPPVTRIAAGLAETSYAPPSTLSYGTTYFWRVDAKNSIGTTAGDVWTFSTLPTVSGPVLAVALANSLLAAAGDATSLTVSNAGVGTMDWMAEVTSGGDWLTVASGASGTDAGTVAISAAANAGAGRTGTVTVRAVSAAGPVAENPKRVTIWQMAGGGGKKGDFLSRRIQSSHCERWDSQAGSIVGKDSYSFSAKMQLPPASLASIGNGATLTVDLGDPVAPGAAHAAFERSLSAATKSTLAGHPTARNPKAPVVGGAVSFVELQPNSTKTARTVTMKWNKKGVLTLTVKGTPPSAQWSPAGGRVVDNAADLSDAAAWPAGPLAEFVIPVTVRLQDVYAGADSIACTGKKTDKPCEGGHLVGWGLSGK
jgi:hypothetical protein